MHIQTQQTYVTCIARESPTLAHYSIKLSKMSHFDERQKKCLDTLDDLQKATIIYADCIVKNAHMIPMQTRFRRNIMPMETDNTSTNTLLFSSKFIEKIGK